MCTILTVEIGVTGYYAINRQKSHWQEYLDLKLNPQQDNLLCPYVQCLQFLTPLPGCAIFFLLVLERCEILSLWSHGIVWLWSYLILITCFVIVQVWPYEENDEYGFVQGLFRMMCDLFSQDYESFSSVSSGLPPLVLWLSLFGSFSM